MKVKIGNCWYSNDMIPSRCRPYIFYNKGYIRVKFSLRMLLLAMVFVSIVTAFVTLLQPKSPEEHNAEARNIMDKYPNDLGLKKISKLSKLTQLDLSLATISDAGLVHIAQLYNLTHLNLIANVSDAGLVHIANLSNLTELGLTGTNVSNAGLVHIAKLSNLTELYLGSTKVSDAGLVHIAKLSNLTHLDLRNTKISDAGLKKLKKILPRCKIDK